MKKSTAPLRNTNTFSSMAIIIPNRQLNAARPTPDKSRLVNEPISDITRNVADAVTNA